MDEGGTVEDCGGCDGPTSWEDWSGRDGATEGRVCV